MKRTIAAKKTPRGRQTRECPVHEFQKHGREAEELRKGIEKIVGQYGDDPLAPPEYIVDDLRKLLEDVDARDSLAFLEKKKQS